MANDISRLISRPKKYKIGKNLPESEQIEVEISSFNIDDMYLLKELKREGKSEEETMGIMKQILSKVLRVSVEEAGKIPTEYIEEIMECVVDKMNVGDEKQETIKAFIDEKKKQLETKNA